MVIDSARNKTLGAMRPLIQRKAGAHKNSSRPGCPRVRLKMRIYAPAELIDTACLESATGWGKLPGMSSVALGIQAVMAFLCQAWGRGEGITHPALPQRLYALGGDQGLMEIGLF